MKDARVKKPDIVGWIFFGMLFSVILIFLLYRSLNLLDQSQGSSAAAWTQAVGSILAILATIVTVYIQNRNEIMREIISKKENRLEKLKFMLVIFSKSLKDCKNVASAIRSREAIWDLKIKYLVEQRDRLSSIPVFDIPQASLYSCVSGLITSLQLAEVSVNALKAREKIEIQLSDEFYDAIELTLHNAADIARGSLKNTLKVYCHESGLPQTSVLEELGIIAEDFMQPSVPSFLSDLKKIRPDGYQTIADELT